MRKKQDQGHVLYLTDMTMKYTWYYIGSWIKKDINKEKPKPRYFYWWILPNLFFFWFFFFFFAFLGLHPWHMEVPRLGFQLELQLLAYATATAISDLSHICDLHHSSWQCQILTHWGKPAIEPVTSWFLVRFVSAAPRRELLLTKHLKEN